jgi:hypothetical protein
LLGIRDKEALLGHPVVEQNWESFVIETLISAVPQETEAYYYRTSNGTEADLLLSLSGGKLWPSRSSGVPRRRLSGAFIPLARI